MSNSPPKPGFLDSDLLINCATVAYYVVVATIVGVVVALFDPSASGLQAIVLGVVWPLTAALATLAGIFTLFVGDLSGLGVGLVLLAACRT